MSDEEILVYVPSVCKDDGEKKAKFKGSVTVKLVGFDERWAMYEPIFREKKDGSTIKAFIEAVKATEPYYASVDIEKVSNGRKYSSLADLKKDPSCDKILAEVSWGLLEGFPEGNE